MCKAMTYDVCNFCGIDISLKVENKFRLGFLASARICNSHFSRNEFLHRLLFRTCIPDFSRRFTAAFAMPHKTSEKKRRFTPQRVPHLQPVAIGFLSAAGAHLRENVGAYSRRAATTAKINRLFFPLIEHHTRPRLLARGDPGTGQHPIII